MNIPLTARRFEVNRGYSNQKTKLEIWYNKHQYNVDVSVLPYFFSTKERKSLPFSDYEFCKMRRLSDLKEIDLHKYSFDSVDSVPLYRDEKNGTTMEDDLPFIQRVCIDRPDFFTDFQQDDNMDILYYDIETSSHQGLFPKAHRDPIIAIAYQHNDGDVVEYEVNKLSDGDEDIITNFMNDVRRINPDVIMGYNNQFFDDPYVVERSRINHISTSALTRKTGEAYWLDQNTGQPVINMAGRVNFDIFSEVLKDQSLYGVASRKMKDIAKYFKVDKKIRQDPRYKNYKVIVEDLSNTNKLIGTPNLKRYITSDILITKALSDIYFKNIVVFAKMLNAPINLLARRSATLINTITYIRELKKMGIVCDLSNHQKHPFIYGTPTGKLDRFGREIFKGRRGYEGPVVKLFRNGHFKKGYKVDFKGLYPSIIRTFNLSPETTHIVGYHKYDENGFRFEWRDKILVLFIPDKRVRRLVEIHVDHSKQGFLPRLLTGYAEEREQYNKQLYDPNTPTHLKGEINSKSWCIKIAGNSSYGINAATHFRPGDVSISLATTGIGRFLINKVIELCDKIKVETDTDGLYTTEEPDLDYLNKYLNDMITKEFNLPDSSIILEMDGPYDHMYFYKMKNYILSENNNITLHGNSFKGTNRTNLFDTTLRRCVSTMFNEPDKLPKVIQECFNLEDYSMSDFVLKTHIRQPLSTYKSRKCLQVKLAEQVQQLLDINVDVGDMIEYVKIYNGYRLKDFVKRRQLKIPYYLNQIKDSLIRLGLSKYIEDCGKTRQIALSGNIKQTQPKLARKFLKYDKTRISQQTL